MFLKRLDTGMLQSNCYIVGDAGEDASGEDAAGAKAGGMGEAVAGHKASGEAVVIDPGVEPREVSQILKANQLILKYIILTHAHIDHIVQVGELKDVCGGKVVIHEMDAPLLGDKVLNGSVMFGSDKRFREADILVKDGDTLEIGSVRLKFIHTPGHTPGSMCIKATECLTGTECGRIATAEAVVSAVASAVTSTEGGASAGAKAGTGDCCIFTGDTLFRRGVGRTDLGAGDSRQLAKSLSRLMELQDELTVYPGHGPATSIGHERKIIGK